MDPDLDPDLEDGEIDDDDIAASGEAGNNSDEGDSANAQHTMPIESKIMAASLAATKVNSVKADLQESSQQRGAQASSSSYKTVAVIDMVTNDSSWTSTLTTNKPKKKQKVDDDDHANSIELAIASALKKRGIEPPMPKLLEAHNEPDVIEISYTGQQQQSRNSRRRKRKRQRDDLAKERNDKKKRINIDKSIDDTVTTKDPQLHADDEFDDYEMLNVRGGSPPHLNLLLSPPIHCGDSDNGNSCNSNGSFASPPPQHRLESRRNKKPKETSRKPRRARTREERDEHQRNVGEKKSRLDAQSEESSKYRQEMRKLELCKFYLMECCAKKDKCSYMHSEFPCKYYYLGMDCVHGEACKFSHGKPLTEQLRNILLKHLETAPKEILGAFKRICRDTALTQITSRHEELCKQFGVENKLTFSTAATSGASSSTSTNNRGISQLKQQHQQQKQQLQHQKLQQQQSLHQPQIPSLLDIIIEPPPNLERNSQQQQKDKLRKSSRWCGNKAKKDNFAPENTSSPPPSLNTTNTSLPLKNLTGLINADIIEKLQKFGVSNLDQLNQLRFGQLAKIGLTITDISDIQINAQKLAKLELSNDDNVIESGEREVPQKESMEAGQKIGTTNAGSMHLSKMYTGNAPTNVHDTMDCSNSNSNHSSNSGVVIVDYTQYLKDSNLAFERGGDLVDDEKDEEQLVIDDELDYVPDIAIAADKTDFEDTNFESVALTLKEHNELAKNNNEEDEQNQELSRGREQVDNTDWNFDNIVYKNPTVAKAVVDDDSYKDLRNKHSLPLLTKSFTDTLSVNSAAGNNKGSPGSPEVPIYERPSMYDYNPKYVEEERKSLADMRFNSFNQPFQPAPANEIDASVNSHLPIPWKLEEVDVPRYTYGAQNFTSNQTIDPRVRRILKLPELPKTNTAASLGRNSCNTIASPDSNEIASPNYYTPPSTSAETRTVTATTTAAATISIYSANTYEDQGKSSNACATTNAPPRIDPRRAAAAAATAANTTHSNTKAATPTLSTNTAAQKQNIEIRNLLQKSDWYKNLNSTSKIMVNQQLALVSSELKKFHQQQNKTPDQVFDTQFITSNPTLQQILTSLGIYINYNGEVSYLDADNSDKATNAGGGSILPNLHQMPPNVQQPYLQQQKQVQSSALHTNVNQIPPVNFMPPPLDFLRGPPPNMTPTIGGIQYMPPSTSQTPLSIMPPFAIGPPGHSDMATVIARPLIRMTPLLNTYIGNPYASGQHHHHLHQQQQQPFANVLSAVPRMSLLGNPPAEFANLRGNTPSHMQRNFGNNPQRHNNRNTRQNIN